MKRECEICDKIVLAVGMTAAGAWGIWGLLHALHSALHGAEMFGITAWI